MAKWKRFTRCRNVAGVTTTAQWMIQKFRRGGGGSLQYIRPVVLYRKCI